ncbi:MAG: DPP IV N-terminal domain-containing protein [Bacteroidia bacterium]
MIKRHLIILGFLISQACLAQNKLLTLEDAILKQRTTLAPDRLSQIQWVPGTKKAFYVAKKDGKEVGVFVSAPSITRDTFLYLNDFNAAFRNLEVNEKEMNRFPFFTWTGEKTVRFFYKNAYYLYNTSTQKVSLLAKAPSDAENLDFCAVNNHIAYTVGNNLFINNDAQLDNKQVSADGNYHQKGTMITNDGTYGLVNGKAVHRNEFGINKGTFWSNSGNKLAYYKMYEGMVADYNLMNINPAADDHTQLMLPTTTEAIKYPMAGNKNHIVKVNIYDLKRKRSIEVKTGDNIDQYLTNIAFSADDEYLFIAIVNREQNKMDLNMYDANTGSFIRKLFTESNSRYVEPEKSIIPVKGKNNQFLWFSERDGYNHLYLFNTRGELIKQVTKGNYAVSDFIGFDPKGEKIYYMAYSDDGLNKYCYETELKTLKTKKITNQEGQHTVLIDENYEYVIDQLTALNIPRRTTLMDTKGTIYGTLQNAINPLGEYKQVQYKLFNILSTDKTTKLNCRMVLPMDFDSTKKYPVIVYVYGGPHAQMVTNSWLGGGDMWFYYMAQQGYIVFTLDNRGSANRGFEFESIIHRNLGKIEMEDQLAGVNYLKTLKYVDPNRMGIFGWSFGGFMSTSLMTKTPDVFKVGVAGGPVIDWRMYEIMYTERYMDTPQENPDGYKEANLINYVKNLKGKLLLIHGTNDDVVLWQHTLTYLKKCVDEGVLVDYFVYPGHAHNVLGPDRAHLYKKITQYFKENL